jgi:serine/threonine-protein kinase
MQETGSMAQNDKGGSDLDIFEGLGKGSATARAPSTGRSVPPPPPVAKPGEAKRTLLGITAPATTPMLPTGGVPSPSRMPPPPPGRSSLPPVVAPTARTSSIPPPPAPSATKPANANASATASVDMDWDEEDEATHIFDEAGESTKIFDEEGDEATKIGVEQASSVTTRAVPAPAPSLARPKATLLGLTAPQMPQPSAPPPSPMALHVQQSRPPPTRPPPPPSGVNQPFGRASTPPPPPGYGQPGGYPQPGGYAQPGYPQPANAFPAALPTTPGLGLAQHASLPLPPPMRPASVPPPPSPMATLPPNGIPRAAPIPQEYSSSAQRRGMEATQLVRPQQNRTTLYAALAGGAVLVVGALVLLLTPRSGRVLVNVTDTKGGSVNHVEIFLDGRKQCDTAPCIVDQVGTGPHEVKLFADGYDTPPVQTVSVESRRDAPANFVLGSAAGTGIRISGTQPGVKLYIDDREAGPLPQEIRDLSPGDHVIKVAGSERYQPLEKHVSVEKDRVEDLGSVTLKVLKGKATISLGTSGARVYLVSGADRRELPMLPISVDIDTTKAWALEGNRPGFLDYRQAIGFDDGQAERTYVVTLDPKSSSSPPSYSPPVYYGGSAPVERPAPAPREAPAPRAAPAAAAAAEGGGEGFLTINSIPPSTCFLDGKSLGATPKVHFQVSAGTHTVKFVNADEGLTKTLTVTVGAGETKPAVAKLN